VVDEVGGVVAEELVAAPDEFEVVAEVSRVSAAVMPGMA
jgi:hypothetical protein